MYTGQGSLGAYDVADGGFDRRWSVDERGSYSTYGSIGAADGVLYRPERTVSGAETGRLALYEATDGAELTTVGFPDTVFSPAVGDDSVFASTADVTAGSYGTSGRLQALTRDGERQWAFTPDASLRAPVVANDAVYTGPWATDDVPLVAFDAASGDELWRRATSGTPEFAAAGETLFVGTADSVRALRA